MAHPHSGSSSTWFLVELEIENAGFWGEGKTGVPGEKPLGAKEGTNNKFNPHIASTPGFEPGPQWWEASALTTAPSLAPRGRPGTRLPLSLSGSLSPAVVTHSSTCLFHYTKMNFATLTLIVVKSEIIRLSYANKKFSCFASNQLRLVFVLYVLYKVTFVENFEKEERLLLLYFQTFFQNLAGICNNESIFCQSKVLNVKENKKRNINQKNTDFFPSQVFSRKGSFNLNTFRGNYLQQKVKYQPIMRNSTQRHPFHLIKKT